MVSVENKPTLRLVAQIPASEKEEGMELPVIKVYKNQTALTINGVRIDFRRGPRWEFMLRLFEGPITKDEIRNFLRERSQYGWPETYIHNIRARIEPDPKNPTLLIESKIDNKSIYKLNARIEIAESEDLPPKRPIKTKKTTPRTGPDDKEEDEKNLPTSPPPLLEFFYPIADSEEMPRFIRKWNTPVPQELLRISQAERQVFSLRLTRTLLSRFVDVNDKNITLTQDPHELIENIYNPIAEHYSPDNLKIFMINSFISVLEKYWDQHERKDIYSYIETDIISQCLRLKKIISKASLVRLVCSHFGIPIPSDYQASDKNSDNKLAVTLHPDRVEENHRRRQPNHDRLTI